METLTKQPEVKNFINGTLNFLHGFEVNLKVAGIILGFRAEGKIGFLLHDNLIDESNQPAVFDTGNPWGSVRCIGLLQFLEQRHEIPYRVNVMPHEKTQVIE